MNGSRAQLKREKQLKLGLCFTQVDEAQRGAARATQRLSDGAAAAEGAMQSARELKQKHQEACAELLKLRRSVQEEGAQNRHLRQQIRVRAPSSVVGLKTRWLRVGGKGGVR